MAILGASNCDVKLFSDRVEKTGPYDKMFDQLVAYMNLKASLGSRYSQFFPKVISYKSFNWRGIRKLKLTIERVGKTDLEQMIIKAKKDSDIKLIKSAFISTFKKIHKFHKLTRRKYVLDDNLEFIKVILDYWISKREKKNSSFNDKIQNFKLDLANLSDSLSNEFIISNCHFDFGTNSLVIGENNKIVFIDPVSRLGNSATVLVGSGARDWATLVINLERRIFEINPELTEMKSVLVDCLQELEELFIKRLIKSGWFSERFFELNKFLVYFSRTLCQCQFCSSSLIGHMGRKLVDSQEKLINFGIGGT